MAIAISVGAMVVEGVVEDEAEVAPIEEVAEGSAGVAVVVMTGRNTYPKIIQVLSTSFFDLRASSFL